MKLEQDLRIVIKAAAEVSKKQSDRYESMRLRKLALEAFLKAFPAKKRRIDALTKSHKNASELVNDCEAKLEKEFGIGLSRYNDDKIIDDAAFVKAGGKLPKSESFTAEQVIAKYASASTKEEAAQVLKSYGIVWK